MLLQMALFHSFLQLTNIPVCVCVCVCVYNIYIYLSHLLYPLILTEAGVKPPIPLFGVRGRKHPLILLKMTDKW